MLKLYEVYYSNLDTIVKFKGMLPDEADRIKAAGKGLTKIEYVLMVLETCIFNLQAEVIVALRKMTKEAADDALTALYNGCVMLNPGIDAEAWLDLTYSINSFNKTKNALSAGEVEKDKTPPPKSSTPAKRRVNSISKAKFVNLERYLRGGVIGQGEAITQVCSALKRAQTGLNDPNRPLGVFMFCGPSGVGKTHLAKELHSYLFENTDLIRVDCGEYQHKHENQKLIGSPPGYVGHDEGGQLTKSISKNPNSVILLDEAEKAHPDFWHTFLKVFDDGFLTDSKGNHVSFRNAIIIITSNLGNDKVSHETYGKSAGFTSTIENQYDSKNPPKRSIVERVTNEEIRKFFKPEFINRLDDIIIFNHLSEEELKSIADLEMLHIANKLSKQHINMTWDEEALSLLVRLSGKAMEGARGMSKIRRERIENPIADLLLNNKYPKGTIFNIRVEDDNFIVN